MKVLARDFHPFARRLRQHSSLPIFAVAALFLIAHCTNSAQHCLEYDDDDYTCRSADWDAAFGSRDYSTSPVLKYFTGIPRAKLIMDEDSPDDPQLPECEPSSESADKSEEESSEKADSSDDSTEGKSEEGSEGKAEAKPEGKRKGKTKSKSDESAEETTEERHKSKPSKPQMPAMPSASGTSPESLEKSKELHQLVQFVYIAQARVQLEANEIHKAQAVADASQQQLEEAAMHVRAVTAALQTSQQELASAAIRAQTAQLLLAAHDHLLFAARQDYDELSSEMVGLQLAEGIQEPKLTFDVHGLLQRLHQPLPAGERPTAIPPVCAMPKTLRKIAADPAVKYKRWTLPFVGRPLRAKKRRITFV